VQAGTSETGTIIEAAEAFDLVIIGDSEISPLSRLLSRPAKDRFSNRTTKRVLREAKPTTVLIKRRLPVLRSFLQRSLFPHG